MQIVDRDERFDRTIQQDQLAEPDEDHDQGEEAIRTRTQDRGKDREKDAAIAPVA